MRVIFRFYGKAQTNRLEDGDQCLERWVALRRERAIKRFPADAGLCCHRAQATIGFRHGAQCEQSCGPVVGIVEGFHRRLQIFHRQFPVGAQFGDFRLVVRYRTFPPCSWP